MEEKERIRPPLKERAARRRQERRKKNQKLLITVGLITIGILGIIFGVKTIRMHIQASNAEEKKAEQLLSEAEIMAAGYDYEGAVEKIKSFGKDYVKREELASAVNSFEAAQEKLVPFTNMEEVTHVFFHTLIKDNAKAFDGDIRAAGYNQYMTTISEFEKMLQEMYDRGYVLIDLYDMVEEEKDAQGNVTYKPATLMLPEGKIPFVMSQDDVCYYDYMTKDGFASKIVIDEDGYPTCEYIEEDGTVTRGDFDLVPILERFIQKHPDFSYHGARAILAVTGYEGLLGYRVSPEDQNYREEDIAEVKKVVKRMKELGWVFASHSWGHQKYGQISFEKMKTDAEKWEEQIDSILGGTDILIYANGVDIAGVEDYSQENEKYEYLKSLGFRYFCNVDAHQHWVQIRQQYVRQGRRNLDGYRMYYNPDMLEDLFDVSAVWDQDRPTPVPPI